MNIISSKSNNTIKQLKKLRDDASFRREMSLAFLEGERLICDTPEELITNVYIIENYAGKMPKGFSKDSKNVFILKKEVFDTVSNTVNSAGIIATSKIINGSFEKILLNENKIILILNSIKDPGNMGTIIRTAESAGVNAIIIDEQCTDIFSPKVVRSSMSSLFRTNIYKTNDLVNTIKELKNNSIQILATSLDATNDYTKFAYENNIAIILGSESNGIDKNIIPFCDNTIKINMCGEIESLNVAIATAIILFEIKRRKEGNNL